MIEKISDYFEHIPSLHRALILAGGLVFFWIIESAIPLFRFRYNKWKHALPNLFFTFTTIIINFFFALLIVQSCDFIVAHKIGILQWINMPVWLSISIGLMLLDLINAYAAHYIQHKIKFLWKFHIVHHADTHVDTTTANRHHPGESVLRAIFAIVAVWISGTPIWMVFLYQSLSVVLSQFNHANIRLPDWLDNAIALIIVSPNMHKVHHHYMRPETDTNYGNIFSFWDRIFGTYKHTPVQQIHYGLDVLKDKNDQAENIGYQLKIPFDNRIKTDY
jgi:sterol desaturase/sphingolipid hydroxylase (fatty acid hydroxylase superfamily)